MEKRYTLEQARKMFLVQPRKQLTPAQEGARAARRAMREIFKVPDYESAESKRQCALVLLIEAQSKIKNAMAYLKAINGAEKGHKAHDIGSGCP